MSSTNTTTAAAAKPSGSSQLFLLPAWQLLAASAPSESSKMECAELTNTLKSVQPATNGASSSDHRALQEALTSASPAGAKNWARREPCCPGGHWPKCFYCWRRTLNYGSCDECAGRPCLRHYCQTFEGRRLCPEHWPRRPDDPLQVPPCCSGSSPACNSSRRICSCGHWACYAHSFKIVEQNSMTIHCVHCPDYNPDNMYDPAASQHS